jgi:transcriptional regulator GlxA family with amidase domain
MSPRNVARVTPKRACVAAKAVEANSIDAARRHLEETPNRIEAIAEKCGFSGEEPMRDYRKRFASTESRRGIR